MVDDILNLQAGEDSITQEELKPITDFVFDHFIEEGAFGVNMVPLVDFFEGELIFHRIENMFQTGDQSFSSTLIASLTPMIDEMRLYVVVLNNFHNKNIFFDCDAKFWEIYVREALNWFASYYFFRCLKPGSKPSREHAVLMRTKFVEKLLVLNPEELRAALGDIKGCSFVDKYFLSRIQNIVIQYPNVECKPMVLIEDYKT